MNIYAKFFTIAAKGEIRCAALIPPLSTEYNYAMAQRYIELTA